MSTTVTDATSTSALTNSATSSSNSIMGKDDFLKMMIAQLKNQNPLDPMDGTQYASQLAQFTQLEQLQNLNSSMTESINANYTLTQSINNTMMATLIGKDVKIDGENIVVDGQESISLGYNLASEAESAEINIYNSKGALVKTIPDISTAQGDNKLSWDLTDNNGKTVSSGDYTFEVAATNNSGDEMTVDVFKFGTIDGIRFGTSGTTIVVDGAEYSISDITEISN
jgi:flagellar basal-body rod modification protein FlgD